ncbi:MAG: hypothetical protein ABIH38_01855 [Patescibacteria group bacterium]
MIKFLKNKNGVGLIEALISILVVSTLVIIFSNISYFLKVSTSCKNMIHAYELAQEEIESLRHFSFDKLTNRTDADFLNIAYNLGTWQVADDSTNYIYELKSPGVVSGITGLALLPLGDDDNFILETNIKVRADSPAGWQTGFFFRYQDKNNNYRLSFSPNSLTLVKKVEGAETTLYTSAPATAFDIWYTYKLETSANTLKIYRNTVLLTTVTDSSFTSGKIALLGFNGVHAYFDDIKINSTLVTNGDFSLGPLGQTADGWERLGLNDLPSGQTKLTIQDYGGSADVKEIIAKIQWQDNNRTRQVSLTTLISKYGVHLK